MTTIIVLRLGSKNAITARIRKKEGKQSMTSTPRMMISSTMPLKYPGEQPQGNAYGYGDAHGNEAYPERDTCAVKQA